MKKISALILCLLASPATEARNLPWKQKEFNWNAVTFADGLSIDDVKNCHEKLKDFHRRIMDALKKDDVEAFLACWPRESEIEQYLSDYEKFAKTKLPNDTSDANKKGRAIVEARHRMMFGKLRSFLVKTFGNIESIELTELVFDDMAKGIFPESGGYMKIRIPMFISTGNDHDHVVSIDVDGEYFSGNLYLSLSGLIDAIRVFDKNSPGDPRGSLIKYEDIKE